MSDNEDKTTSKDSKSVHDGSRREFIKKSGLIMGGVVGGSLLGGLLTNEYQSDQDTTSGDGEDKVAYTEARMFFKRYEDFVVLEQATERIYPKDDNGPGAIELMVPYFIDKQLAGPWGMNATDYRQGPFNGSNVESVNSRLNRGNIFLNGLRKMNEISQSRYNVTFDAAEKNQQIDILEEFANDEVDMKAVSSSSFFNLIRTTTLEGVYSDPLYGGNRNMEGWKMKEYPGPVPSYADIIEDDEFAEMDPISLINYQKKS